MDMQHWALPISSLDGQLLGIELETRVEINGCRVLISRAMRVGNAGSPIREAEIRWLNRKARWFVDNGLFCVVAGDAESLQANLPFIKYFTVGFNARRGAGLWIDEMGGYSSTAAPLFTHDYEVARFNKRYVTLNIDRPMFPVLINSIRRYCDKIIVPVYNTQHHDMLREAGVWAVQGERNPIDFTHCEWLLADY